MISSILKLFGGISGGWIAYALIAAAVFGAGGFAGNKLRATLDAPIIARAQTGLAQSQTETAKAVAALAEQQRVTAEDALKADAKALATQTALIGQVADLTAKLASTDKARRDASTKLLDTLKAIPHEQQATLSPSVRAYLLGVRDQQRAGARTTPANDHHQDGVSIPLRAAGVP